MDDETRRQSARKHVDKNWRVTVFLIGFAGLLGAMLEVLGAIPKIYEISKKIICIVDDGICRNTESRVRYKNILFLQNFVGDGDITQCNGASYGIIRSKFGSWMPEVRIDTDNRIGGCIQSFALYDPDRALDGIFLDIEIHSEGEVSCDSPGVRSVPLNTDLANLEWSTPYRIDTDDRPGWCLQTFKLSGKSDISLDISFVPDDVADQCRNVGIHTLTSDNQVTLGLHTDQRNGGCRQAFRIRSR